MSHSASHYPIVQLIRRIITESGFDQPQFLASLGYRDSESGLRRLVPWLESGVGKPRFLRQILTAYPAYAPDVETALLETKQVKLAEAEAAWAESLKLEADTFRPYIHVEGETTRPSSITMFGVSGGRWNLIPIPQATLDLELDDQLAALPTLMQEYLRTNDGWCLFFGTVTGFRYVRLLDYFQFDKEGRFVGHVAKPFRRGIYWVSL